LTRFAYLSPVQYVSVTLKLMDSSTPLNLDDYSASATTIKFDRPVPLLRGPTPAGPLDDEDNPSSYVLAFENPRSWAAAYRACESQIIRQCEAGARIGCAIRASDTCKPSWWRGLIGGGGAAKLSDLKERERCEEREMEGCLAMAKEKCVGLAREKCAAPFRDARIAVPEKELARRLVCSVSVPEGKSGWWWVRLVGSRKCGFGPVTTRKASELLGSDAEYQWKFRR
ncbi:hypothetical protein Tsubulata_004953, partial [Turnera subulata]